MREIFTSGSVGRASGNRCLYPEAERVLRTLIFIKSVPRPLIRDVMPFNRKLLIEPVQ